MTVTRDRAPAGSEMVTHWTGNGQLPRPVLVEHTPGGLGGRRASPGGRGDTLYVPAGRPRRGNERNENRLPIDQIVLGALVYLAAVTLAAFLAVSAYLDHAALAKRSSAQPNFAPTVDAASAATGARAKHPPAAARPRP